MIAATDLAPLIEHADRWGPLFLLVVGVLLLAWVNLMLQRRMREAAERWKREGQG